MKALPKRKGNHVPALKHCLTDASMKAPPKREGNDLLHHTRRHPHGASMKAFPKKKGNAASDTVGISTNACLNESPSQKEGKYLGPR